MKVALLLCLGLAGCGRWHEIVATVSSNAEVCVDGVRYLLFSHGASVKYQPDGKVTPCGGEEK